MNEKIKSEVVKNNYSYENFECNLETLIEKFPAVGFLALSFSTDYTFFKNKNNELNLLKDDRPYYPVDSITSEVQKLSEKHNLDDKEIIYVYGIGLGYSYLALKDFLNADIKNTIIFIEDEEDVFISFLHTDIAKKIINDPQVHIIFFMKGENKQTKIDELANSYPTSKIEFTTDILSKKSFKVTQNLKLKLKRATFLSDALFKERYYSHMPFQNFVQNVKRLTQSFYGNALQGAFKNIAALIVGAGPSLEKDIDQIKQLENNALIFAGGSSLPALSSSGITPHIGLALDPNYEEFQRMQANVAQEIPFFYSTRVHPLVFSAFNGLLCYLRASIGGICELWIEEELNLSGDFINKKLNYESLSVTTIALALAEYLGCNPIILVGCDLSFSNGKRYAKGVENNDESFNKFDLIKRKSIHNKMIDTTTHWIMESSCVSNFAKTCNQTKIYNASSSGIGFKGVENTSLKELRKTILKKENDLRNMLFHAIQAYSFEISGRDFISKQLKKLQASILKCKEYVLGMLEEIDKIESDKKICESGKLILSEIDLKEEDAFNYLFYDVNSCLDKLFERTYKNRISLKEMKQKKLQLFLKKIDVHLEVMKNHFE